VRRRSLVSQPIPPAGPTTHVEMSTAATMSNAMLSWRKSSLPTRARAAIKIQTVIIAMHDDKTAARPLSLVRKLAMIAAAMHIPGKIAPPKSPRLLTHENTHRPTREIKIARIQFSLMPQL
jgi:hypothetical protein